MGDATKVDIIPGVTGVSFPLLFLAPLDIVMAVLTVIRQQQVKQTDQRSNNTVLRRGTLAYQTANCEKYCSTPGCAYQQGESAPLVFGRAIESLRGSTGQRRFPVSARIGCLTES